MKVQTIEAGRVTSVSAGRFGYSLKINGRAVPQAVQPFDTHKQAMNAMKKRVRDHIIQMARRAKEAKERAFASNQQAAA